MLTCGQSINQVSVIMTDRLGGRTSERSRERSLKRSLERSRGCIRGCVRLSSDRLYV